MISYLFPKALLSKSMVDSFMFKLIMMHIKRNIFTFIFSFLIFSSNVIFGQTDIQVSKVSCSDNNSFYIDVEVYKNYRILDSLGREYYNYPKIYRLPDSLKIIIIERILEYTSDTTLCCRRIRDYENMEYCYQIKPKSNHFPIRIEALFVINRIAYNSLTSRIACYPVLFDSITGQEINNNNHLIDVMVEHYKEWFRMYKETGKLPGDYFYFNRGRIKWWGKHLSSAIKP